MRAVAGLALLSVVACTSDLGPGDLPPGILTSPVFPIDKESALAFAQEALATAIRPDLIEEVTRPFPGYRGWLRFVIGLNSLTLFIVPRQGLDAAGNTIDGHAFAAWYDGSYDPGGLDVAQAVLDHAIAAAGRVTGPLKSPAPS